MLIIWPNYKNLNIIVIQDTLLVGIIFQVSVSILKSWSRGSVQRFLRKTTGNYNILGIFILYFLICNTYREPIQSNIDCITASKCFIFLDWSINTLAGSLHLKYVTQPASTQTRPASSHSRITNLKRRIVVLLQNYLSLFSHQNRNYL